MSFSFDVRVSMNLNTERKISSAFKYGQYILDNAVIKDSNFYAPEDEQYLQKSALLHSKIGEGQVIWQTVYARRLYYNPQFNFSKDKNPNARGLWFEEAKAQKRDSWLDQSDRAVKSRI